MSRIAPRSLKQADLVLRLQPGGPSQATQRMARNRASMEIHQPAARQVPDQLTAPGKPEPQA